MDSLFASTEYLRPFGFTFLHPFLITGAGLLIRR